MGAASPLLRSLWRGSKSRHREVLHLDEVFDTIFRAFAANPGLLHAAEGGHLIRNDAGIDSYNPILEGLADTPCPTQIAGVAVGSQAIDRVICDRDSLLLGVKTHQWCDRPERLFLDAQ